jgi:hypothetical protein
MIEGKGIKPKFGIFQREPQWPGYNSVFRIFTVCDDESVMSIQ